MVFVANTRSDYIWNSETKAFPPLNVRVNEARLVDGMVPVSKIMVGILELPTLL